VSTRDELALELFIADNSRQSRARSIVDFERLGGETYTHRLADAVLAAGYRKPRTITTAEELDAAIVRHFEQGENLVLLGGWRPWIIWEDDRGNVRVSSLPVEDDPDRLSLSSIPLPATVLYEPGVTA
jgi:hypothetical protein